MSENYYCECCKFKTISKKRYDNHLKSKSHHIKHDRKCNKIEKEQSIESRIQELTNRLMKSEEKCKYFCKFCNRGYNSKIGMQKHYKTCSSNPDSDYYIPDYSINREPEYLLDDDDDYEEINDDSNCDCACEYDDDDDDDENEEDNILQNMNGFNMNGPNGFFESMKNATRDISSSTITTTTNTRITIDGVEICDNPMDDLETKNTLIHSFCHPFFKSNSHLVPPSFFDDDDFSTIFNHVHELHITKKSQIEYQEKYKHKKLSQFKNTILHNCIQSNNQNNNSNNNNNTINDNT